jgi:hypothetical protein
MSKADRAHSTAHADAHSSLFSKPLPPRVDGAGLIDAQCLEVQFAYGLLAALSAIETVDAVRMEGAIRLVCAHIENLQSIGRLAEQVHP